MKFISIIALSLLFVACGTEKELVEENVQEQTPALESPEDPTPDEPVEESTTTQNNYRVVGIVRMDTKGCGLCIETETAPGQTQFLYPVNLDSKFQKEGMKLKFAFETSTEIVPKTCLADLIVSLSDVSLMR